MIKIEFYSESEWEITEYLFLGLELSGSYKTTTRDHYSSWVTIKKNPPPQNLCSGITTDLIIYSILPYLAKMLTIFLTSLELRIFLPRVR